MLYSLTGFAQYRLNVEGDIQVLGRIQLESAGTHNAFVGYGADGANTSGGNNAVFGYRAGFQNTSGSDNTYVGVDPGQKISLSDVRLFLNRPNPFSQQTLITYFIPKTVKEATLEILSPDGKRIKNIRVESRGEGTTSLEASALPAGNYVYRLMADGKLVDSKVMVLTN